MPLQARPYLPLLASTLALVSLAVAARAQTTYPEVKIEGRLQTQGYFLDNADSVHRAAGAGPQSNFFIRRARIQANVKFNEYVSMVLQPSYEGGRVNGVRLRDAFIDVRLTRADSSYIAVRFGQEKRPFNRYELLSSNNLPSIERGAGKGLQPVASNNLFDRNGFLAHDVGMSVLGSFYQRKATVQLGVYNGRGESRDDNNNAKSFGARATLALTPKLNVGGSAYSRDYLIGRPNLPPATGTTPDSSARSTAWALDAQWSRPGAEGLFVVADYMQGEDTTSVIVAGERVERNPMQGVSLIAAYNIRMDSLSAIHAIEPAIRFDSADPNENAGDDESTLLSAVLGVYLTGGTQFRIAYERQTFANDRATIQGVRTAMTVKF